jgi:hypothetical protein
MIPVPEESCMPNETREAQEISASETPLFDPIISLLRRGSLRIRPGSPLFGGADREQDGRPRSAVMKSQFFLLKFNSSSGG